MHRIVVTHRVHDEVLDFLRAHAEVEACLTRDPWPRPALLERLALADGVMVFMPDLVDLEFLDAAPCLRVVAGAFKGCDNVDVALCARREVTVTVVEDLLTAPTADLALALLLALTRNVLAGDRLVRRDGYAGWRPVLYGAGLAGSTVGIVGFGRLGRAVAKRIEAFDARVVCCDAVQTGDPRQVTLDELLAASDHVVLAAPLTKDSHHLFGDDRLARMKRGAFLVNVGRGSVVDEKAVFVAIVSGQLAGYAADVFEFEDLSLPARPRAIRPALLQLPDRTVFTPHLGSAVADVRLAIEMSAARSMVDVLEGRTPTGVVSA